jgi:hypothetical protein
MLFLSYQDIYNIEHTLLSSYHISNTIFWMIKLLKKIEDINLCSLNIKFNMQFTYNADDINYI